MNNKDIQLSYIFNLKKWKQSKHQKLRKLESKLWFIHMRVYSHEELFMNKVFMKQEKVHKNC